MLVYSSNSIMGICGMLFIELKESTGAATIEDAFYMFGVDCSLVVISSALASLVGAVEVR